MQSKVITWQRRNEPRYLARPVSGAPHCSAETSDLRALVAAAREQSFTKAAAKPWVMRQSTAVDEDLELTVRIVPQEFAVRNARMSLRMPRRIYVVCL